MGAWGFFKGYKLLGHLNHLHCQHTAIALSRGWKFLKKGPLNGVWVRKWMYVQGCQLSWIIKGTLHFVSEIWIWNLIWNLDTPHNVHPSGFARLCFCFETLPLSNAVFWLADTFVGFSLISRLAKEWLYAHWRQQFSTMQNHFSGVQDAQCIQGEHGPLRLITLGIP